MTTTTTSQPTAPARRGFLALLTGAAAAAPAIALAAATEPPTPPPPIIEEAPRLLDLGEKLARLQVRFATAMAQREEAWAIYHRLAPVRPEELRKMPADRYSDLAAIEQGPHGMRMTYPDNSRTLESKRLRAHILLEEVSRHTKEGKTLRRLARMASAYEAGRKAAMRASNLRAVYWNITDVGYDACALARAMTEAPAPRTMIGLKLVAQAELLRREAWRASGEPSEPDTAEHALRAIAGFDGGAA
jgi:hypothetical protein